MASGRPTVLGRSNLFAPMDLEESGSEDKSRRAQFTRRVCQPTWLLLFGALGILAMVWMLAPATPLHLQSYDGELTDPSRRRILVTGGTGYIGSHTTVELIKAGFDVFIIDNLANSNPKVLERIKLISGVRPRFTKLDLCDAPALDRYFQHSPRFDAVIHFAGLKAVGESVSQPVRYYDNNLVGTLNLLKSMDKYNCRNLVFSSSACVYGDPAKVPITEDMPTSPTNPYGRTKLMIEQMLQDLVKVKASWRIALLRYFNPIGSHESGLIGEDPHGPPNNLAPYIAQVAVGRWPKVQVFGGDWKTKDGTGVRDYIHVVDLARGHVAALNQAILPDASTGLDPAAPYCEVFNLGTGTGVSVKDMVAFFAKAAGKTIPYEVVAKRAGDVAEVFADASKAARLLKWRAALSVEQACKDHFRWQSMNPDGFDTVAGPDGKPSLPMPTRLQ